MPNRLHTAALAIANGFVEYGSKRSPLAIARRLGGAVFALAMVEAAYPQTKPSVVEMAQLPKYCWSSYDGKLAGTPGYSIPPVCGVGMNHFCSGLTFMLRANKPGSERMEKAENLRQARGEINYTLARLLPGCPIADDVRLADQRLRVMETAAGVVRR